MQMRTTGRTGLSVSAIGCGGIPLFRGERDEAVRVAQRAVDLGINYFDTARGYASGESETRLGLAIKGRRDQVVIASKSGDRTADGIMSDIEASLKTLGTDYIDVYKCHGIMSQEDIDTVMAPGGAMEGLKKAQQQGKIGFVGMSGHRPETLAEAVRTGEVDVILIPFNFVRREPADDLVSLCQERGVGFTVMKPIGGSLFQHADLCLRWVLEHPISTICVGMWKISEVEQNVAVGRDPQPLNEEERQWIEDERRRWDRVYCRLCYKCDPCEQEIPIRELMILDLNYRRFGMDMMMERGLEEWIESTKTCKRCENCVKSCSYHLPIPTIIEQLRHTYEPMIASYKQERST